jgi:PAS domain S-box-containing protein
MSESVGRGAFADGDTAMQFLAGVLDAATEYSIIATDADGVIQLWNEGAHRLYGYEAVEIVGQHKSVLHTGEDKLRGLPESMMRHARESGKWEGTVERVRKDRTTFTARVVLTRRHDADGEPIGFLLMSSDITGERRLNLASMSHELRTPLNAILGFTGTMLMGLPGPLNDEQTKQLRTVQASGRQLLSLINDLLDLARIEAGKRELKIEPIGCEELLDEIVLGLRPLADAKGLELAVLAPAERLEVRNDRRSVSQILINLANNAIKFTDEGSVRLDVNRDADGGTPVTRFTVTDTGCGIEARDQRRLFAAFEQLESSRAHPYESTGLGLRICRTLATLIGAQITFESELDKGSAFTLELRG